MTIIAFQISARLTVGLISALAAMQTACLTAAAAQQVEVSRKAINYQIRGWEHDLVEQSPNLSNYFWNPQSGRRILTTRHTTAQARHASNQATITSSAPVRHYVKPIHIALPATARSMPTADSSVSARLHAESTKARAAAPGSATGVSKETVLTYSFRHPSSHPSSHPRFETDPFVQTKQSVFGQIVH